MRRAMQIWPAIDLRGGKCVRLQQGDYQRETVFGEDPVAMAKHWVAEGAEFLHLVDLDGARDGRWVNRDAVLGIASSLSIPCELGGGIRDEETIHRLLEAGLSRLVVGTKALKEPEWFRRMANQFPHKLAIGIDAKDGQVATDGWLEVSSVAAADLARDYEPEPIAAIIYTDIARDGMMAGANVPAMRLMKENVSVPVIASGGVTTLEDVRLLAEAGLDGCIIGRSLYDEEINLRDAIAVANEACSA